MPTRFLLMADVAEQLNVSMSQVYHMVRSGELPAIKVGGRGQWRIEATKLEEYIERKYQSRRPRRPPVTRGRTAGFSLIVHPTSSEHSPRFTANH